MLELDQIISFYPEKLQIFKKNILREYIQYKILEIIFNSPFANKVVFMGGTALRIVYDNSRFSEDMDFDNLGMSYEEFAELIKILKNKLILEGYDIESSIKLRNAFIASLKLKDILYNFSLPSHVEQKLIIEIDAEQQNFNYIPDKKLINKFDVFTAIFVVPVDILLAQKIFAILNRPRTMGRDLHDCIFLFGRTTPNFKYLKEKTGIESYDEVRKALMSKTANLNLKNLSKDISPFIFEKNDIKKVELFYDYIK
jgi:predicted nucleotidyltransferase component of viral defense system